MSKALREHDDTTNADHIVVFHDVTWEDYERVLEMRGDKSSPRINYLEGELEIMSPSRDHEQLRSFIGRLVETWCIDRGMDITPFGSWTLKGEGKDRAAEADECYTFSPARNSSKRNAASSFPTSTSDCSPRCSARHAHPSRA